MPNANLKTPDVVLKEMRKLIAEARALKEDGQWGEAIQAFQGGIDSLKEHAKKLDPPGVHSATERLKRLAVVCHIEIMECELRREQHSLDAGLKETITYKVADLIIKKAVGSVAQYRMKGSLEVWNWFYLYFSTNEGPFREKSMAHVAEAFFHWAKICRMRFFWQRLKWRNHLLIPQRNRGQSGLSYFFRLAWNGILEVWENAVTIGNDFKEWLLLAFNFYGTGFRGGVIRPIFRLVIIPWFLFAFCFLALNAINISGTPINQIANADFSKLFLYALSFSVYTFTGAGPGDFTLGASETGHLVAMVEVGWGYLVTVLILGQLLNTISSLAPQNPKDPPPLLDE